MADRLEIEVTSPMKWQGFSVNGEALHVGLLPERKSVALYKSEGSRLVPLAYFTSEDHAIVALDMLNKIASAHLSD